MANHSYVPLFCKTHFSFLEGASDPEDLVTQAHGYDLSALAVMDRDGVYGVPRAYAAGQSTDTRILVGAQVTVVDWGQSLIDVGLNDYLEPEDRIQDASAYASSTINLLACSHQGYRQLCRLLSLGRLRCQKGQSLVTWQEVAAHSQGLMALWGGHESLIVQADAQARHWVETADLLQEAFGPGRVWPMLCRHRNEQERPEEYYLLQRRQAYRWPIVAATEVLYHDAQRRPLQDVLTCIRHGTTLDQAGQLLRANGQHALLTPQQFVTRYRDLPDAVANTQLIAQEAQFTMAQLCYRYPLEQLPDGLDAATYLRQLTFEGAQRRYPLGIPKPIIERIDKELQIICTLEYEGYFLTLWDIVEYCKRHQILCQGRGSAANSVVCYCLHITSVNPTQVDLLFERFISIERAEPPDIDLDIAHQRREEVIQYVYDKHGRQQAAMVANMVRYRIKSAIRDVGKVLGLPPTALDRLAKLAGRWGRLDDETITESGLDPTARSQQMLCARVKDILDTPRHLSIHPGGFLLGHEPVHDLVPIEHATMPGRTVISWDKEDVETLGLFKVDLLGLGALSHIDKSLQYLKTYRGLDLNLATIPKEDHEVYTMIGQAKTIGVFQIESRAQMSMLPRLKPNSYYDLVIEVSIVRPGPITGGMVHPYLNRRNGLEPVIYPHPCLEPVLKKTLGVPLFQEQVMQLAVVAADYTPGEADQLRRDMAAWRRSGRIEQHRDRLISRMQAKGIALEFAERVFEQIRGFGEYGFPESHAASFALIAYITAWLKCRWPSEFACGLLNAQPMGFYRPSTIIEEAKRDGVDVRPICINRSDWDCSIEPEPVGIDRDALMTRQPTLPMRIGLRYVRGLAKPDAERILAERQRGGPFRDLYDFFCRNDCSEKGLKQLAKAGCFDVLGLDRRQTLWQIQHWIAMRQRQQKDRLNPRQPTLNLVWPTEIPKLQVLSPPQTITWDYRASKHSTRGHPVAAWRDILNQTGCPSAADIATIRNGQKNVRYVGQIICRQRPGTASGVTFLTLEDETGFVNAVVWPDAFEQYSVALKTWHWLGLTGEIQNAYGVVHLVVESVWLPDWLEAPISLASRDFH